MLKHSNRKTHRLQALAGTRRAATKAPPSSSQQQKRMSERTHTSPDGNTRLQVLAQLSHVILGVARRDYAGVTIFREERVRVRYNLFDPSTWSGRKFVRRGSPRSIVAAVAFLDSNDIDIASALTLHETDRSGHFGLSALFVNVGSEPVVLGNDARSVRKVRIKYVLPWETDERSLSQT